MNGNGVKAGFGAVLVGVMLGTVAVASNDDGSPKTKIEIRDRAPVELPVDETPEPTVTTSTSGESRSGVTDRGSKTRPATAAATPRPPEELTTTTAPETTSTSSSPCFYVPSPDPGVPPVLYCP